MPTFISTLHPLLVHFPIALVLVAAASELMAIATPRQAWRAVAVVNVRVGAAMGVVTAMTGWGLALPAGADAALHAPGEDGRRFSGSLMPMQNGCVDSTNGPPVAPPAFRLPAWRSCAWAVKSAISK